MATVRGVAQLTETPAAGVRRGRSPLTRILALALLAAVGWLAVSVGLALTAAGSDSTAARLAEWARGHGLSSVVDRLEKVTYSAPAVGGRPAATSPLLAPRPTSVAATPAAPVARAARRTTARSAVLAPVVPFASPALPGEGQWRVQGTVDGVAAVQAAFLRPDQLHTSYTAAVVRMDQRVVSFALHPGTQEPGPGPWAQPDRIVSSERADLLAAFNGGFRIDSARGGFFQGGRTVGHLRDGAASFVLDDRGHASIGTWGRDMRMSSHVAAVRQNLDLLLDAGVIATGLDSNTGGRWGATLGNKLFVWRSGAGQTADGSIVYASGNRLSAGTLAALLKRAGCVRAMELDINPEWTSFVNYPSERNILPDMQRSPRRYDTTSTRDFFTVSRRR